MPKQRIKGLITYANTGSGFRTPAKAIEKELVLLGVDTKSCDFLAELNSKFLDQVGKKGWKLMLKRPILFEFIFKISNTPLMKSIMSLYDFASGKAVAQLASEKPDFIFSTHPFSTDFYSRLVKREKLNIPVFGYNSDVILSHQAYISNTVKKYFVSSKEGYNAMVRQGQAKETLVLSGFPIDRKFRKRFGSLRDEQKKLGLKDKFTLLLMLGGEGIGPLESAISAIIRAGIDIQVVAICGMNEQLLKRLEGLEKDNPNFDLVALGFVSNVQDYLYCCNIAGGKSGVNSFFESIFMKKPFIVLKAMANEKFAARLIVRKDIGWWPETEEEFISILRSAQNQAYLKKYVLNIKKLDYSFNPEEIAQRVIKETAEYKLKNLRGRKCLLFDLAGTICDVPVSSGNWEGINIRGIEKVLKKIEVDRVLTSAEFRQSCREFVKEKVKLRALAKKTLNEFEVKQQLRDFFRKLSGKNRKLGEMLGSDSIGEEQLASLEELFISTELEISELFRGADKLLERLSKKYKLFLLCNNASSVLVKKILDTEGISWYFDEVFVSADVGIRKPHKKFLEIVLERIREKRENCVIIGDRLNQDIRMANDAGIPSIFVTLRAHEDNRGIQERPDYQVSSIRELEKLLLDRNTPA